MPHTIDKQLRNLLSKTLLIHDMILLSHPSVIESKNASTKVGRFFFYGNCDERNFKERQHEGEVSARLTSLANLRE